MTHVSWLLQHVSDLPATDEWLSLPEREVLARYFAPKRIRDWRLGRWTGKRALARAAAAGASETDLSSLARISIRATESGSPCAFVDDRECGWVISLSHAGEYGACAVARQPVALGCDIEMVGRRGEEFVIDWFTGTERRLVDPVAVGDERSRIVTLIWSAKESALKALGVGLRLDTREVEVHLDNAAASGLEWASLAVDAPGRTLHGWWRASEDRVLTIVSDPPPAPPIALDSRTAGLEP